MCMCLYAHIYTQSGFGVPCLAIGIAVSSYISARWITT